MGLDERESDRRSGDGKFFWHSHDIFFILWWRFQDLFFSFFFPSSQKYSMQIFWRRRRRKKDHYHAIIYPEGRLTDWWWLWVQQAAKEILWYDGGKSLTNGLQSPTFAAETAKQFQFIKKEFLPFLMQKIFLIGTSVGKLWWKKVLGAKFDPAFYNWVFRDFAPEWKSEWKKLKGLLCWPEVCSHSSPFRQEFQKDLSSDFPLFSSRATKKEMMLLWEGRRKKSFFWGKYGCFFSCQVSQPPKERRPTWCSASRCNLAN